MKAQMCAGQLTYLCAERVFLAGGARVALWSLERRQPRLRASMTLSSPLIAAWAPGWAIIQ